MQYREYGSTGKKVSLVGFGGMRFEQIDNRKFCVDTMMEAARAGITYFDTAPGYFGTKSEEVFGEAFKAMRAENLPFYCATKTTKSEPDEIRAEIEGQLDRLGLDAIDFYHVWCIVGLDEWQRRKNNGVIKTFQKLKEEGLIRHICVSSHLIGDEIRQLLDEGVFEGVLFGYSAYNFAFREKAFEAIARRNLGCVVMNPLGGGIIPKHPEIFDFIKTQPDETVVEAGLRFLFAHPEITTTLVGFSNPKQVKEAVAAVEGYKPISKEQMQRIRSNVHDAFKDLCTGCRYCENCPEGIPIPQLMEAYNNRILYGDDQRMLGQLKWHWNVPPGEAERCIGCGECEEACTQHLNIIERLAKIAEIARSAS